MYQVALCEDEKIFSEMLEKTCRIILDKQSIEHHISVFDSSAGFWAAFSQEQKRYDIILLDIVMDGVNGMELARMVRKADKNATIIFITSNRDYALQGYDVNALHYLMKPVDTGLLERLITSDYHNRFKNEFYIFGSGSEKTRVSVKDIICLETVNRRVAVTLLDRTIYHPGKLSELLDKLPKFMFVRCHQAFAININNILELNRKSAIAINGKSIPVSRTFAKDVQKSFVRQIRDG